MKVLSGSSQSAFAQSLAQQLSLPLAKVEISHFPNGEKRVWIDDTLKGENVVLVQSFSNPPDEHIMEFLLIADALERMGVRHINAVIPWFGYSLQDKEFRPGEPIAAKVVANLISHAYIKRAFLLDLHNTSTPGFFSIPVHHLTASELFAEHARQNLDLSNVVVASPDFGGLKRAKVFAEKLGVELVKIDKYRDLQTFEITNMGVQGNVAGKDVIICDDIINTGSTVVNAAEVLKQQGAKCVHFFATHGPLVASAFEKLNHPAVDSVVVTNSIPQPADLSKVKVLDVSPLFAEELNSWLRPG